jgi:hypothetical protein
MPGDGPRTCPSFDDHGRGWAGSSTDDRLDAVPLEHAQRVAADEVDQLVSELEPTLDAYQRRLLHQVRLAAESLGAIRVASIVRGGR